MLYIYTYILCLHVSKYLSQFLKTKNKIKKISNFFLFYFDWEYKCLPCYNKITGNKHNKRMKTMKLQKLFLNDKFLKNISKYRKLSKSIYDR